MATGSNNEAVSERDAWTRPPFLRRVRIRNYKSIAFCDVNLQPLTILVGRNAAGKSNFLDALAFLRDALAVGVTEAVRLHGGLDSIRCRTTDSEKVAIGLEAAFPSCRMACVAEYTIELTCKARGVVEVERETLRIQDAAANRTCGFTVTEGRPQWFGLEQFADGNAKRLNPESLQPPPSGPFPYPHLFDSHRADRLLLGVIGSQPFIDLGEGLRTTGFYQFNPEEIRKLHKPNPGRLLEREGGNLAGVIAGLKEIQPPFLYRVGDYLSVIAEDVQNFDVIRYGEYETVRFRLRSDAGKPPLEFDAASMSDGTLRALAALMAAFQIGLPMGPTVIGIEEPETALHPAAMRALVDALEDATQRTQVLLTTHSADLLSGRDLTPGNILVVRNRAGQSHITPVDPASRQIIDKELYSLADLHRMDQLELDEADLKRQARLGNGTEES